MTYSIVARDAATGDLAVAVQSKFLAVGAVVPWARAGVGAVATQAFANAAYGPDGLALLEAGASAQATLDRLLGPDRLRDQRQAGIVDARGDAASHTGPECFAAADAAGGDRRGRESAALLVVREAGGYGGGNDRWIDLRVDDHADPIGELGRVLELQRLYFHRPALDELVRADESVAGELRSLLGRL